MFDVGHGYVLSVKTRNGVDVEGCLISTPMVTTLSSSSAGDEQGGM